MAALDATTRAAIRREFAEQLSHAREGVAVTKAQLAGAIAGLDEYLDANAVAINQAIPNGARTALTTKQKALLLSYVALKRYGVI